ncbi:MULTISPECIES: hypothetical protein [Frankia]|uniref:Uncharacterized protein n=1 Tax=Frankia alni (strain DSM 45986 / CECT 9034 / ACN14a) TaxID=326424 RepID=Q0RME0_FRAAA|nr:MULTISPECIES: hypothetical protein [Frankia]CAJ61311.1 hypothetical protein; putative signal peptide [Frankia alni ACN14a]
MAARLDLAMALAQAASAGVPWGVGVVTAVNADGTLALQVRGDPDPVDHIAVLDSYTEPAAGHVVLVLHGGGQMIVLGRIRRAGMALPPTSSPPTGDGGSYAEQATGGHGPRPSPADHPRAGGRRRWHHRRGPGGHDVDAGPALPGPG